MVAPANLSADKKITPDDRIYLFSDMQKIVENSLGYMNQGVEASDVVDYNDPANWPYELAIEIPIFREGKFEHWRYDYLDFTVATLDKIIENFNKKVVPHDISFDMEHLYHLGALAWLPYEQGVLYRKEVPVKTALGDKMMNVLFAKCILNRKGVEKILGKEVRYFSSEIHPDFTTNEIQSIIIGNGAVAETVLSHGTTLVGGGFTNRPFIPGMSAAFSSRTFSTEELKKGLKFNETSSITLLVDADLDFQSSTSSIGSFVSLCNSGSRTETHKFSTNNPIPDKAPVNENPVPANAEGDNDMATVILSALMTQINGKSPEDSLILLSSNAANIDPAEKATFNMIFSATQQAVDAKKLAEQMAHEAEQSKQSAIELSAKNVQLQADLLKSKEQSWSNLTKSFSQELSAEGHHTAVVNEVNRLFSAMPSEVRSMKFSVGESEYDIKGMVKSIMDKIPKESRMTTEFSLSNQPDNEGARKANPNNGAFDGSNPTNENKQKDTDAFSVYQEADRDKAKKFFSRYGQLPGVEIIGMINNDGLLG